MHVLHIISNVSSGELIGISYLYDQNGQSLQDFPDDPDEPIATEGHDEEESEEDGDLDVEDVVDEGFDELSFDSLELLQSLAAELVASGKLKRPATDDSGRQTGS